VGAVVAAPAAVTAPATAASPAKGDVDEPRSGRAQTPKNVKLFQPVPKAESSCEPAPAHARRACRANQPSARARSSACGTHQAGDVRARREQLEGPFGGCCD
jgi:hypothetical protein